MKKQLFALLLALLMTAPAFLSCSESGANEETAAETDAAAPSADGEIAAEETVDDSIDENGYLKDDLPDELDFEGQEIKLLYWSDVENQEFTAEEFTGEIVNDAIYQRNLNVEDDLNVKYTWIGTPGNGGNIDAYVAKVRESHTAGDNAYDIYASYSRTIMASVINGFTTNLEDAPYLDFDKPWWPDNLLKESTINNHLYLVSGDISTNVLHMMYCVYYNRQLLEDYQLENPTDLVFENRWTLDALVSMSTGAYLDLNGNTKKDIDDQFGFTITDFHNDAFYTGSDLKLVEHDAEKILIVSPDFFGEKSVSVIEKLGPWETSNDVYVGGDYEIPFTEGRSVFTINRAHYASKALRDSELSYGIVPVPKYDEAQADYRTVMGNPVTLYSISVSTPYKDICAAVLECMASNGYRLTTPAIFENNMKAKYSTDNINAQMYDIVRESVSFELGRFMNKYLSNITDIFFAALVKNDANWGSTAAKYSKPLAKQMDKVVESLLENEANLG
ncbi:MAG: hypothetical protein E7579_02105 [Ruminococcaceae bacterium]|nr:hypothetical protein [Oscillospiraceae bacterium]